MEYMVWCLDHLGFQQEHIEYAIAIVKATTTSFENNTPLEISQVRQFPLLSVMGFPAICSEREVKAVVACIPGFVGFASKNSFNILTVFVWWQSEEHALNAKRVLTTARLDTHCTAAVMVSMPFYWLFEHMPPPIWN